MQRRHIITALLLLSGALLLGQGFYMQAKAQLAQVLIAHSWQQNQHGNAGAKPWPWADIHPVAKLSVPRLHLNQYIMQDASGAAATACWPATVTAISPSCNNCAPVTKSTSKIATANNNATASAKPAWSTAATAIFISTPTPTASP